MELITLLIGGAIVAAVAVAVITMEMVWSWVRKVLAKTVWFFWKKNYTVRLIREALSKGKYAVVANVFDKRGELTETNAWKGRLDSDLHRRFGNSDVLVICD